MLRPTRLQSKQGLDAYGEARGAVAKSALDGLQYWSKIDLLDNSCYNLVTFLHFIE